MTRCEKSETIITSATLLKASNVCWAYDFWTYHTSMGLERARDDRQSRI